MPSKQQSAHWVGAHTSAQGGVSLIFKRAHAKHARAIAFFTKNQRSWKSPAPVSESTAVQFKKQRKKYGFEDPKQVIAHANYLENFCSVDQDMIEKTRCSALGVTGIVIHTGSDTKGVGMRVACAQASSTINWVLSQPGTAGVTILLENSAGQGHCIGSNFKELREIVNGVEDKTRIGICLDTCHAFAAGFDLRTRDGYERMMSKMQDTLGGVNWLQAIHINDSESPCGARADRHANIGRGKMGLVPFWCILNDSRTERIPIVLETPPAEGDYLKGYQNEIGLLYSLENSDIPLSIHQKRAIKEGSSESTSKRKRKREKAVSSESSSDSSSSASCSDSDSPVQPLKKRARKASDSAPHETHTQTKQQNKKQKYKKAGSLLKEKKVKSHSSAQKRASKDTKKKFSRKSSSESESDGSDSVVKRASKRRRVTK